MAVLPRVGEFVKFRNETMGDYFAFEVTSITYRESGVIEVWTDLLDNIDGRMYSFEEEEEFDKYLASYLAEGWRCEKGVGPNTRYRGPKETPR